MSEYISRREMLARGLGAAALLGGGGVPALLGSRPAAAAGLPDRSKDAPTAPVAIQRCESFEAKAFRAKLDKCIDLIGGIDKLVRGKTVTVKVNLTGMEWKPFAGMPAYETYQTHPNTVAALCAILDKAGAHRIYVVESMYWIQPTEEILQEAGWDVAGIKSAGGNKVAFEDTRNRGRFPGYSRFKVPWGGFIYPSFDLNSRFEKTDVLISLAKLKEHACAGVTGVIKNMFGAPPSSIYGDDSAKGEDAVRHRAAMFHSARIRPAGNVPGEVDHNVPKKAVNRVPHITADIYGARPTDLGIVEGIRTIKGGEGWWNRGVALIEPKVLLVGRNGICTDSVCAAVMGFDPQAGHGEFPFPGDNHLRLLAARGIGTNDLERIDVRGLSIKEALCPFRKKPAAKAA